jgi:hypothetical protein
MSQPTKAEKALMTPGLCLRCGKEVVYPSERNSAGHCTQCHNIGYHEYKAARKKQIEEQRKKGIEYWQTQGINVGDMVFRFTRDMPTGMYSMKVYGKAKAGLVGAYVYSTFQPGYLSPEGWKKA